MIVIGIQLLGSLASIRTTKRRRDSRAFWPLPRSLAVHLQERNISRSRLKFCLSAWQKYRQLQPTMTQFPQPESCAKPRDWLKQQKGLKCLFQIGTLDSLHIKLGLISSNTSPRRPILHTSTQMNTSSTKLSIKLGIMLTRPQSTTHSHLEHTVGAMVGALIPSTPVATVSARPLGIRTKQPLKTWWAGPIDSDAAKMKFQFMLTPIHAAGTTMANAMEMETAIAMAMEEALEIMNRSDGSQVQIQLTIKYLMLMWKMLLNLVPRMPQQQ